MARVIDLIPQSPAVVRRGVIAGSAPGGYSVRVAGRTIFARSGGRTHRPGDSVSLGRIGSGWVILEPLRGAMPRPLEVIVDG